MNIKTEKKGSYLTLALEGELNTLNAAEFEKEYEMNKDGATEVILDLEKLTYISSSGLRAILCIRQELNRAGGTLCICNVPDAVMEVFRFTGFARFLNIR